MRLHTPTPALLAPSLPQGLFFGNLVHLVTLVNPVSSEATLQEAAGSPGMGIHILGPHAGAHSSPVGAWIDWDSLELPSASWDGEAEILDVTKGYVAKVLLHVGRSLGEILLVPVHPGKEDLGNHL